MKQFATSSSNSSPQRSVDFKISLRMFPYLTDHGFQDMIVLPGAFYVDLALLAHRERSDQSPAILKNAVFNRPIVLSESEITMHLDVEDRDDLVQCTFRESTATALDRDSDFVAKIQLCRTPVTPSKATIVQPSVESFQRHAETAIAGKSLYKKLTTNGNQYGPQFQNLKYIWRKGNEVLGQISWPRAQAASDGAHCLHPALLDSVTQMLAPFLADEGQTFVLRSIEEIRIATTSFPESFWGHATLRTRSTHAEHSHVGEVTAFDDSGHLYLELSGVTFDLLGRMDAAEDTAATKVVVTSNFTADLIEDPLNFWAKQLGGRFDIEFAPYNQVFQQLLDTQSAFHTNTAGANIILLSLEEWVAAEHSVPLQVTQRRIEESLGERDRCVLPNGMAIAQLNQYETDYVYKEIFEDRCYLRHGICLEDGCTVIDIGANIGLFSLFVMGQCKNPTIYAYEPSPVVFDLLKANCAAYGATATAFNLGVSDRSKTALFTFYENSSVFSGFYSNKVEDLGAIEAVVRNMLSNVLATDGPVDEYVRELAAERLHSSNYQCQMTSVSDLIRENGIKNISLLKIDAEKSEIDVLKGICEDDWPKIDQIVIEIHDPSRRTVSHIETLLRERGFQSAVEQEDLLENSGLFNLYATRNSGASADPQYPAAPPLSTPGDEQGNSRNAALSRNIDAFCSALASFATKAAAPTVLCVCPRSPAAQGDSALTRALNQAEGRLATECDKLLGVMVISSSWLEEHYPLNDYYDPLNYQAGHIPYTLDAHAVLATAVFRVLHSQKRKPFKVAVLDCDNTLWKGVCGETGSLGVALTQPFRALQQFFLDRMNEGILLCLCSKNNEADVLDVFQRQPDMLLTLDHIISRRINWNDKSTNIRSLASELNLGLDSFIFLDDNPVECAEVRIGCPDVVTLQLPDDPELIPSFLNHVWAFDSQGLTAEDHQRARMYQQNSERERVRQNALSLTEFIQGLHLEVTIEEMRPEQLARISQLTQRTNQFNVNGIRRSEHEIIDLLKDKAAQCLTVHVKDRFGDYGLVGVVSLKALEDRFALDTFLLSCRVLGRGVEYEVLRQIGIRALQQEKQRVDIPYVHTGKNLPARDFLRRIGAQCGHEEGSLWTFPAEYLANLQYSPAETATVTPERPFVEMENISDSSGHLWKLDSSVVQDISSALCSPEKIARAVEDYRSGSKGIQTLGPPVTQETAEEGALLQIWRRVLGNLRIGLHDNFFEVGGTSLKAVQVVAGIKKELKQSVSIVTLFECPTISLLAAKLRSGSDGTQSSGATSNDAALRGRQRRYRTTRNSRK